MRINRKIIINIFSVIVFLFLWQIVSYLGVINPLFLSSPEKIFQAGIAMVGSGFIWSYFFSSMQIFFVGFSLSIVTALILGFTIGTSKKLLGIFEPYIQGINSLPLVAVIPLFMIWFGIGLKFKIVIVFILTFIPMMINIISGIKNTDQGLVKMLTSYGATKFYIIKSVVFFSTLPFIFSGLRIATGRGIVALVLADLFGKSSGLGYLIISYGTGYQTAKLLFVVFLLIMINFSIIGVINFSAKKALFWQK